MKYIQLLSMLAVLLSSVALHAQNDSLPPLGGVVLDEEKYSSTGEAESATRSSAEGSRKSLLEGAKFPVFNQRCEAACGACAVVAALMIRYKLYCDEQCNCDTPFRNISWSYLHNQLIQRYGQGKIHLKDVLDLLKEQGILLVEDFPNTPCSHDRMPTAAEFNKAKYFKDWTYQPVYKAKKYITGSSERKEAAFRSQLVSRTIAWIDQDIPVIIGLLVTDNFRQLKPGDCRWYAPDPLRPAMGHALLVVGYDDARQEFELLNSFGTGWGCYGLLRIGYADFTRAVQEGYVLQFDFDSGKEVDCTLFRH